MSDRHHPFLIAACVWMSFGLSGCASSGTQPSSAWRPAFGGLPSIQPGVPVIPRASSGLPIQSGTGPQPTPAFQPSPTIQPGPSLPDASARKWPAPYPESASTRRPPGRQILPTMAPRPEPGVPVASEQVPAALSGEIEIIPGPAIRRYRPQVEILPPPPAAKHNTGVEILPPPDGPRFEALPAPM